MVPSNNTRNFCTTTLSSLEYFSNWFKELKLYAHMPLLFPISTVLG